MASLSIRPAPLPLKPLRALASTKPPLVIAGASTPSPVPSALIEIERSGVIACLRAPNGKLAMEAARAAFEGGITVLEIVMSTPGVLEVIQGLVEDYPSLTIGVGTVLSPEDARKAVNVGAKFIMSPSTIMEILFDVKGGEVLYIPGVMTPTEVLSVYNAGARIVKVYPITVLGGVKYMSALRKPFPHIPMIASQGIPIDSVQTYIKGGASAVVLSDAIFEGQAIRQRDFNEIYRLARIATMQGARNGN